MRKDTKGNSNNTTVFLIQTIKAQVMHQFAPHHAFQELVRHHCRKRDPAPGSRRGVFLSFFGRLCLAICSFVLAFCSFVFGSSFT